MFTCQKQTSSVLEKTGMCLCNSYPHYRVPKPFTGPQVLTFQTPGDDPLEWELSVLDETRRRPFHNDSDSCFILNIQYYSLINSLVFLPCLPLSAAVCHCFKCNRDMHAISATDLLLPISVGLRVKSFCRLGISLLSLASVSSAVGGIFGLDGLWGFSLG